MLAPACGRPHWVLVPITPRLCHGQTPLRPLGHHGQQCWGHVALPPPGRRAEHSSDTGVVHGLYSPHTVLRATAEGLGPGRASETYKCGLFPSPRSQGLLGPQGDRAGAVTAVQGARCACRGVVREEPGWAKLMATAAQPRDPQPQPLQGMLRLRGERALSPGSGALGGAGSSPLRLMTTVELWHGAGPPPTALLSLAMRLPGGDILQKRRLSELWAWSAQHRRPAAMDPVA